MFERRVTILLLITALPAAALIARLVQLQAVHGPDYRQRAEDLLDQEPVYFPCLRGDLTDRYGRRLAYDAPSWNIGVHYEIISSDERARKRLGKALGLDPGELTADKIEAAWLVLAELSGGAPAELKAEIADVRREVERIKNNVAERHGYEMEIKEERRVHTLVSGLDQPQQIYARQKLAPYRWLKVQASLVRRYAGGPAVGHLLGRLAQVSADDRERDPQGDDELFAYQLGDLRGVNGAEALGERWLPAVGRRWLRGRRGRTHENRKNRPLSPPVEARNGETLQLSIDLELQQNLYEQLRQAVRARPLSTGGCAVLLHIPTRQVLAMVDYPSFDPNLPYSKQLELARTDPAGEPLLFRAVGGDYPPGSIVKPMILAAALSAGVADPQTRVYCPGYLLPENPNRWRCLFAHGEVDPLSAVQRSCNVFFYKLGEALGTAKLTYWLAQFGLGRLSGTGLPEEQARPLRLDHSVGGARNTVIGQGNLAVTPVQIANMLATLATGEYRPVTIWVNDPRPPAPAVKLPVSDGAWRIVREGMYAAVNAPGGTAFSHARLDDIGDYVLLGKTGSADTGRANVPTHAWFGGYLTRRDRFRESAGDGEECVAIAVVIEYAGHGGEQAGPLAAEMLRAYLRRGRPLTGGASAAVQE